MQIFQLLPEIVMSMAVLILFFCSLAKLGTGALRSIAVVLSLFSLVAAVAAFDQQGSLFFDTYRVDPISQLFKVLITLGLFLVLCVGRGLSGVEEKLRGEYFLFLTVGALGLALLGSSNELLTMVMSLEISAFALYVIIPFRGTDTHREHIEAAIKYFLFGVVATGIMLYGMSCLFGLGKSTYLGELAPSMPGLMKTEPLAAVGMVMTLCGFFYKLAMFPMHYLTPDVYEGTANETASYIATLPKIAAVAVIVRLVSLAGPDAGRLTWVLAVFSVLSMTVGNLAALVQNDLKRLLAYSSIAHAGYVMTGILSANTLGLASAVYYMLGYLLMNLACFHVICQLAPAGKNVSFADLRGLHHRSPLLAFTLAAGAVGLTGIPPTIGFTGKFLVFTAAFQKGYHALVILAVVNTAISLFYYLKMVRAAYGRTDAPGEPVSLSLPSAALSVFLIASIIAAGIMPQGFIALAKNAVVEIRYDRTEKKQSLPDLTKRF